MTSWAADYNDYAETRQVFTDRYPLAGMPRRASLGARRLSSVDAPVGAT
jgi:enamine deaminase RidA (YjgF/YER057c/UK114 family)